MVDTNPFKLPREGGYTIDVDGEIIVVSDRDRLVEIESADGSIIAKIEETIVKKFMDWGFCLPTDFCPSGEVVSLTDKTVWIVDEIRKDLLKALKHAKWVFEGKLTEPWRR